jgi:pimeloyl-ACP methyl ester carboxylesterase
MTHRFALTVACGLLLLAGSARAEEGTFDSNGVKIHYVVEGKGEPVLLIHGFAVNKDLQWGLPGIIKVLSRDHLVVALDNRGHGKSAKPTDPGKYGAEMVEDAVRLLDHLKIKKAHVVGYSMGAMITAKLVATHPDRLLSATLGGGGPLREGMETPRFLRELVESLEQGKGMGPLIVALRPAGKPRPSPEEIERINRLLVRDNGKALAAALRGLKDLTVTDKQLKTNRVPALALVGEIDPLQKKYEDARERLANLEVVVIPGADHITAFTNPKFLKALRKFLDEHAQKDRDNAAPAPRREP